MECGSSCIAWETKRPRFVLVEKANLISYALSMHMVLINPFAISTRTKRGRFVSRAFVPTFLTTTQARICPPRRRLRRNKPSLLDIR